MNRSPMRMALGAFAASVLVVGVVACGGDDSDTTSDESADPGQPLLMGLTIGESGFLQPFDVPAATGAQLAADDLNSDGGVNGQQVELVTADNKSDLNQSQNAASDVLDEGAEALFVSGDFAVGAPAARLAGDQNKVAVSMFAGEAQFGGQGVGPLAFNMGTIVPNIAAVMAEWSYNTKELRNPFILEDTSLVYSKDMCRYFRDSWDTLAGDDSYAGEATFLNSDKTIASQVEDIKQSGADSIVLCSYNPGGATVLRQLRAAGIDLPVVTGDGMDGDYWFDSVPNLSNFYEAVTVSIYGDDPNPEVNDFVSRYTKVTGEKPQTAYAAFGYATMQIVAQAIADAETTDGDAVAEQLEAFTDVQSLVGSVTFTPDRHFTVDRTMQIIEVSDGQASQSTEVTPETIPDFGL